MKYFGSLGIAILAVLASLAGSDAWAVTITDSGASAPTTNLIAINDINTIGNNIGNQRQMEQTFTVTSAVQIEAIWFKWSDTNASLSDLSIDLNGDGDVDDAGESVYTGVNLNVGAAGNWIKVDVVADNLTLTTGGTDHFLKWYTPVLGQYPGALYFNRASAAVGYLGGEFVGFDDHNSFYDIDFAITQVVPEPCSCILLAFGLVGLGVRRRRRS